VPRGFKDTFASNVISRQWMIDTIREVYERYGFAPLETPAVEYVDALGKFLPESNSPAGGIFAFQDEDNSWLALRYDLTAPLSRVFAEHRNDIPMPFRRYQVGPVWRNEKPGPGRYREFYQFDIDTVGAASMVADAEVCCVLADALEAIRIPRGDYVIKVNNRKALNGVLEVVGLPSDENTSLTVLRAIDKLDRLGIEGVKQLLGKGRYDAPEGEESFRVSNKSIESLKGEKVPQAIIVKLESLREQNIEIVREEEFLRILREDVGDELISEHSSMILRHTRTSDFTGGARLRDDQVQRIIDLLSVKESSRSKVCDRFEELVRGSQVGEEGVAELREIDRFLTAVGYAEDRVTFDPTVVRGLAYYTGPVFEAQLTFEVSDESGQKQQFGSVAGGGRYDYLVERFLGEKVPATGASIGVDRLLTALATLGKLSTLESSAPVLVTVMDADRILDYERITFQLRRAGIPAEMYLGEGGFRKQLQYADERGSVVAVIVGSREFEAGQVSLKDLRLGRELSKEITEREAWVKEQPSQITVPEQNIVQEVKAILERYKVGA
jgi:histidyl-tRNA synthetase